MGLQGQQYQVHGADDTVFGLLSTPRMAMNGLFTYIALGDDCDYNHVSQRGHGAGYSARYRGADLSRT